MRGYVSKRRTLCGAVVALNATRSRACEAKAKIARLEVEIRAAKARGDLASADALEGERAHLIVNSLIP